MTDTTPATVRPVFEYEMVPPEKRHQTGKNITILNNGDTGLMIGFSAGHGVFFRRNTDASVTMSLVSFGETGEIKEFTWPENEWASIVCCVSHKYEDAARWNKARDFHGRPKHD